MPIYTHGRSQGFTLVEMSIVLVIIGLIIGGILKGQEVIASARQKATINQINAVKSATSTYFDRYRALPGDDPSATSVDSRLTAGDGNGVVGATQTGAAALAGNLNLTAASENYQFFNGLIAANLLNGGTVTSVGASLLFGDSALPAAPISGSGMTVVYGQAGAGSTARSTHWVRVHKTPTGVPGAAMSPRTLANIDTQIDDGLPQSGGVRGDDGAKCNNATASYLASDDLGCVGLFEVTQ